MQRFTPLDPARAIRTEKECVLPWFARKLQAATQDKDGVALDELTELLSIEEESGEDARPQPTEVLLKNLDSAWAKAMVKALEADYDALLLALSGQEQEQSAKLDDLQKILVARKEAAVREIKRCNQEGKAVNPELLTAIPAMLLLPSVDAFHVKIRDSQHQRLLFLAAIQLLDNPDAAISDQWPIKYLPIRLQRTAMGFTLDCDSVSGDKAKIIRLNVGE